MADGRSPGRADSKRLGVLVAVGVAVGPVGVGDAVRVLVFVIVFMVVLMLMRNAVLVHIFMIVLMLVVFGHFIYHLKSILPEAIDVCNARDKNYG